MNDLKTSWTESIFYLQVSLTSDVQEYVFADMCRMAFVQAGDRFGTRSATEIACQWINFPFFQNFPKLSADIKENGVASPMTTEVKK